MRNPMSKEYVGNNLDLFREAMSKVEDPRQRGMFITCDADGKIFLARPDSSSGMLSRYDLRTLQADIHIDGRVHMQVDPQKFVRDKLFIFMFNADYGPKAEQPARVLPKRQGTFQVYHLRHGFSNPQVIAASVVTSVEELNCQLDLTAIGVGNYKTKELLGVRAVFSANPTRFGVAAITTSKEVISLWYREKLEGVAPLALPADEDEDSLFEDWEDSYEY